MTLFDVFAMLFKTQIKSTRKETIVHGRNRRWLHQKISVISGGYCCTAINIIQIYTNLYLRKLSD